MTTQYTPILQLALPVTGELNGTWGDVVNDNITSMVEEAIAGLATISTWTTNAHTLTTADGVTDEARCAMLVLQTGTGGTALGGAGQVICPTRTKLYVVKNDAAYAVTVKTSGGSGVAIAAGDTAFVFCDGTNVNACVTQIINGHITGNLTVDGNTTLGNATSDTITATARFASDVNPSADNTYDLGTSGNSWRNLYIDGTATIASLVATTADINGGTIDATSIGATTPSTGVFTQVNITGQGDLRLEDTTGGEYVALQAPSALAASYTLTMPADDGTNGQALITDGSGNLSWSTAASGDVYGPASATDNAVARFDGTTGKLIQNSAVTIGDDGATVIAANSSSDALRITQTGAGNALLVEDSANPDSTPFVITNQGALIVGNTTSVNTPNYGGTNFSFQIQGQSALAYDGISLQNYVNGSGASNLTFAHSRSGVLGTHTVLATNDITGTVVFSGSDGTEFIRTAQIESRVDGTPGTNDMPGRLVFSTTAEGASSPTERMRIDSKGNVGVGSTAITNVGFRLGNNISGNTTAFGVFTGQSIRSDVTASASYFSTSSNTEAASFTLTSLVNYRAAQGTFGAGSTVTNQYGFSAESSLTGATNNYGFHSNIASGTGRWNFYAGGTADNYFAGTSSFNANLLVGTTTARTVVGVTPEIQLSGASNAFALITKSQDNTSGSGLFLGKSRGTEASPTVVASGDTLCVLYALGYDGTDYIQAATIGAAVDGTPGTNDMPGRLVFSTTADGASSPTERMRIDSKGVSAFTTAGQFGISIAGTVSGGTTNYGAYCGVTIGSSVTVRGEGFQTALSTQAGGAGLSELGHFKATQGTLGTAVTNQYGFLVDSSLTGATNNYGFFSNIASGTGRWNFYAAGTADNYFAGKVGVGNTSTSVNVYVEKNITGAVSSSAVAGFGIVQSDVTSYGRGFHTYLGTAAASFTLANLEHFQANQWTIGAGSAVTNQVGFVASSSLTGATNNYGFYSNIASGTGRWNFYAAGTADNYFAGSVGIGSVSSGTPLYVFKNITGSTSAGSIGALGLVQSDVTTKAAIIGTYAGTAAAAFTLPILAHFEASQWSIGAGSAVTNQYGFYAQSSLTGATNNYGFYSAIASGTGRYNFYAAGTADNYMAGALGIGALPSGGAKLLVTDGGSTMRFRDNGTSAELLLVAEAGGYSALYFGDVSDEVRGGVAYSSSDDSLQIRGYNNTERMRIDSAGRVGIGGAPAAGYNFNIVQPITGAATTYALINQGTINSDVTAAANIFTSAVATQATTFSLTNVRHYYAYALSTGAGSTVTNQVGFFAESLLTGATNNYGFYSNIASGTGRYNFYAAGSADNYFAGKIYTASTLTSVGTIYQSAGSNQGAININCNNSNVTGASTLYLLSGANNTNYSVVDGGLGTIWFSNPAYQGGARISGVSAENQAAGAAGGYLTFSTTPTGTTTLTERMRIDANGNLIHQAPTTPPTLATNGTMVFNLTSNTNLRVSVRGSDGVTRTANITLA